MAAPTSPLVAERCNDIEMTIRQKPLSCRPASAWPFTALARPATVNGQPSPTIRGGRRKRRHDPDGRVTGVGPAAGR